MERRRGIIDHEGKQNECILAGQLSVEAKSRLEERKRPAADITKTERETPDTRELGKQKRWISTSELDKYD